MINLTLLIFQTAEWNALAVAVVRKLVYERQCKFNYNFNNYLSTTVHTYLFLCIHINYFIRDRMIKFPSDVVAESLAEIEDDN